jgi:hypothetical protein
MGMGIPKSHSNPARAISASCVSDVLKRLNVSRVLPTTCCAYDVYGLRKLSTSDFWWPADGVPAPVAQLAYLNSGSAFRDSFVAPWSTIFLSRTWSAL